MHTRAVEDASARLRELRHEEWEQLGIGALALALAIVATRVQRELAVPLFLGGLGVGALGMRALLRRWDLVERLSGDRDAYVIAEVLAYATRSTTMERRHSFAELIRSALRDPVQGPFGEATDELEALAAELDDSRLALDPASAVACLRLLSDLDESPLLNPKLPTEDVRWRIRWIRSGFHPCRSGEAV